jgi:hypothetical protein
LHDWLSLGTLESLLETKEGKSYFIAFLNDHKDGHPELAKYYDFYLEMVKAINLCESTIEEQKLHDIAHSYFNTYVALDASNNTRLVDLFMTRSKVNEVEKSLKQYRDTHTSPKDIFIHWKRLSIEYLDENVFRSRIITRLAAEKERRG